MDQQQPNRQTMGQSDALLVLACLLLTLPPTFGSKFPPPQSLSPTQPQPTQSTNSTGHCNAGYMVQGALVGPPGRNGLPGGDGLPGASGSQGKNGADDQPGRNGATIYVYILQ